jgi:hypothetical protein
MAPKKVVKSIETFEDEFEPEPTPILRQKRSNGDDTGSPAGIQPREDLVGDEQDETFSKMYNILTTLSEHGFQVEGEFKNGDLNFKFAHGVKPVVPKNDGYKSGSRDKNRRQENTAGSVLSILGYGRPPSYRRRSIGYQ